eukprot:jgi/Ulvmu1/8531/UM044_0065.1
MSILATLALAMALVGTPSPAHARPLDLAVSEAAMTGSTQHAVAARRLHMRSSANNGNEGNEGNEGDEGDEGDEGGVRLPSKRNGKYQVCVKGNRQGFGVVGGVRKPDGIIVTADGRCTFSEYAGGFDGFWSTDAGDGHEDGLALAAKRMLGDKGARVGASAGRNNPRNRFVNEFLQEVRDRARPVDLDHPEDEGIADGGKRVDNIRKASKACTELIQVHRC